MPIDKDKWQSSFERQLDIAEKKQIAIVKRFYKREYNKGIESFIADGQTNFQLLFDNKDLLKIYRDLYTDIGMRYPQTATNNAKRMIEWREKYGDEVTAGTATGWRRASMLANREPLTIEMLNRIKSFFARHEGNQTIADQYKDTPWRDNGFVSWNLWGGTAMRDWVNKKLNEINE